jgi:hypothetical protein
VKAFWLALCVWLRTLHDGRPEATTFAEGQQALMIKLLARAGIAATGIVLGLVGILIWGGFASAHERLIIYIMAGVIGLYALTNLAVVLSFAVGGPVGRIDLEATRQGIKLGANKDPTRENSDVDGNRNVVREIGPDAEPSGELAQTGS